jgi:hypothetical protein
MLLDDAITIEIACGVLMSWHEIDAIMARRTLKALADKKSPVVWTAERVIDMCVLGG